jgi:hypothetical protein
VNNHKETRSSHSTASAAQAAQAPWGSLTSGMHTLTLFPQFVGKVLLLLLELLVLAAVVVFVASWMLGEDSITIASFTDTSPPPADGSLQNSKSLGQVVADALAFELDRISQLQTLKNPWGSSEQLSAPRLTAPQPFERVGPMSVADVELPLGELVLALKPLLPHRNQRQVITGSVQRFTAGAATQVRIVARLEEAGKILKHWSIERHVSDEGEITALVQELAFQVMWSTLDDVGTRSYYSFRDYIDGVDAFRKYKDTHSLDVFTAAEGKLQAAVKNDEQYARAHYFLGTLYSWRAYYGDAGHGTEVDYEEAAMKAYRQTERSYSAHPREAKALAHFGFGLVAYRRYLKEKRAAENSMTPDHEMRGLARSSLDEADRQYGHASDLDPAFYFARAGRALIYQERGWTSRAIEEFHNAKAAAGDRASTDWIGERIARLQERENAHEKELQALRVQIQGAMNRAPAPALPRENSRPRLLAVFSW